MSTSEEKVILVVEDQADLREAIKLNFIGKPIKVLTAENGVQALEIVKSQKIHLVLSDVKMPGGDGITLLENIRSMNPEIPVVFIMTGFSDYSDEELLQKGANSVIRKPFHRKDITSAVFAQLGMS